MAPEKNILKQQANRTTTWRLKVPIYNKPRALASTGYDVNINSALEITAIARVLSRWGNRSLATHFGVVPTVTF